MRVVREINAAYHTCETCRAERPTHCPTRTTLGISGRNGTFADYLRLPHDSLHLIPSSITDEQAVFIEPLAAACEITQHPHITPTDDVIIIGDGKLGLLLLPLSVVDSYTAAPRFQGQRKNGKSQPNLLLLLLHPQPYWKPVISPSPNHVATWV